MQTEQFFNKKKHINIFLNDVITKNTFTHENKSNSLYGNELNTSQKYLSMK